MRSTLRLLRVSQAQAGKATPSKWFKDFRGLLPRESVVSPGLVVRPSIHQRKRRPEINSPDSRILTRNTETGDLVVNHDKADSNKTKAVSDLWLRDRCKCSECINPDTLQRKTDITKIPLDVHVVETRNKDQTDELAVTWSDGHESTYDRELFRDLFFIRSTVGPFPAMSLPLGPRRSQIPPRVPYSDVMTTTSGLQRMTDLLAKNGLVFITQTPTTTPLPTRLLLERIAFIRHTHYGGFYDFTADLAMADTAYTNLALGAHTDTTYFSDPAGLQAFHVLSHTPDASSPGDSESLGGESLLVDGFRAARALRDRYPQAYEVLAGVGLPWHASGNEGIAISPDKMYPVLERGPGGGEVVRVRWNNDDRGGCRGG
ncbi:hypothetical protein B0T18DRAFT_426690 [Schizothecium vesticola]|uniref:Trimethyllysine dioxygenase n=1 Tax=Schizothecium vesticola TaxID=314040 RepID=A0AA40F6P8_9PEZI|nr:hypothetical protein B0T18DRAFT_426690 [Schizothecium vesticola]